MATVVQSYNIFLDTERNLSADSTGDNIALPLGQSPITCSTDQFIRLTLNEFSMAKSFTDINELNNEFLFRDPNNPTAPETVVLPPSDYSSSSAIFASSAGFKDPIKSALTALRTDAVTADTITIINPTSAVNSDNILKFNVTYSAGHGYAADADVPILQSFVEQGRSYTILGGKRISDATNTTFNSMISTRISTTVIQITGFYNSTYFTSSHMYVRLNEQNSNIGMSSLNSIQQDTKFTEMSSTKVLGIIPIDTGYARYVAQSDNVFFTDIMAKQVAQMRVQITDALGNEFPLIAPQQNTLGNRHFTAVIRVDIYQYPGGGQHSVNNHNLESTTPARFSSAPATRVGFLQSNGLNGAQSGLLGNGFYNVAGKLIS